MLLALVLAQLALQPANPAGPLFTNPATMGSRFALFEAFPASGAGTSGACSTTPPTGAKGEALTFTRSTGAWCTNDDYSLTFLSANQPRVMRGRGPSAPLALYVEETAGQNDALHNRDGSQAVWTKTNATCTKTATGVDGVANSATRCTASAANGTVLQAIVRASAANATSVYVRRNGGTSGVEVTRDNGTTWNAITASITSDWKRAVCKDAEGCMGGRCVVVPDLCATSANPTIGFRIVGSGDSIDFDLAQNEAALWPSSPITSAGVAGARGAEAAPYFTLPAPLASVGSISGNVLTSVARASSCAFGAWQSNTNFLIAYYGGGITASAQDLACGFRPTSGLANVGSFTYQPGGGFIPQSCAQGAARTNCTGGRCNTVAGTDLVTNVTRVYLGCGNLSGSFMGMVQGVCVDGDSGRCGPQRTSAAPALTHVVWLGDSITFGNVSAPTRPPYELQGLIATLPPLSRSVMNGGHGGDDVAAMKVRWDAHMARQGWGTLVFLGGINDLRNSISAADTYATAVQILDDARARGMRVVVVGILPWAGYIINWTAGKQVQTDAYNALLSSWAATNGQTYVSTDSLGETVTDGGTGMALKGIYDSGDGLHPNAAGSAALAALVAAANP